MAIKQHDKENFNTLKSAWQSDNVALIESKDKNGEYVALICAVAFNGNTYSITPFAEMVRGNPFELYDDPTDESKWER